MAAITLTLPDKNPPDQAQWHCPHHGCTFTPSEWAEHPLHACGWVCMRKVEVERPQPHVSYVPSGVPVYNYLISVFLQRDGRAYAHRWSKSPSQIILLRVQMPRAFTMRYQQLERKQTLHPPPLFHGTPSGCGLGIHRRGGDRQGRIELCSSPECGACSILRLGLLAGESNGTVLLIYAPLPTDSLL